MSRTFNDFLSWERANRETIDFKVSYVDMSGGDVLAGLLLSQIVYWHLPGKKGESKLRVEKDGKEWLVKGRSEWYEEIRLTARQVDAAVKQLKALDLIETARYRFNGAPTMHIHLNRERFVELWDRAVSISPNGEIRFNETVKSKSPIGEISSNETVNSISPNREILNRDYDREYTETTDKDIAATNNVAAPPAENPSLPLPFQASDPAGKQPPQPAEEKTTRAAPKRKARKPKVPSDDAAKAEREGLFDAHVEAVTGQGPDGGDAKAFASLHGGRIGQMVKDWQKAGGTLASFRADYCAGGLWYTLPARQSLDGQGRATNRPTLDAITKTRGNLKNHQATWHPAWPKSTGTGPPARAAPEVTGWDYTPPTLEEFEAKIDKRPITRPRVSAEQLRGR